MKTVLGRSNLAIAVSSMMVGILALVLTSLSGGGAVGYSLGTLLVVNSLIRYRISQRD